MKRSFFGPILFLGIIALVAGYAGMFDNFQKMKAADIALENFIARYQNGNDYNALFNEALARYEEANFLQSECTAFPVSFASLGLFLVLYAFDHRNMFKKYQELTQHLEGQYRQKTVPENSHTTATAL
jgi:hypothetical protein